VQHSTSKQVKHAALKLTDIIWK